MMQLSPDMVDRLRGLLAEGRKIEAIKLYREQTGAGLAQAKDAIESLGEGWSPAQIEPGPESMQDLSPQLLEELRQLLAAGHKIEAIKVYRERTGADLARAKDAVEAFGRGQTLAVFDAAFASDLQRLLAQGRKIEAIRRYRERSGCGLKQAKEAVDRLRPMCPGCGSETPPGATKCPRCGMALRTASQSGLWVWIALAVALAGGAAVAVLLMQ